VGGGSFSWGGSSRGGSLDGSGLCSGSWGGGIKLAMYEWMGTTDSRLATGRDCWLVLLAMVHNVFECIIEMTSD
jgi:hypothetical protein